MITGADGQLGQALAQVTPKREHVIFASKRDLDITDGRAVAAFFDKHRPEVVIHTAGYTQVDRAETEPENAFRINATAVELLSGHCKTTGTALVHLSTDYVFDGRAKSPYTETDEPNPQTAYGRSKLAGEKAILQSGLEAFAIIRTAWLYSPFGHNFYNTMLALAAAGKPVSVVDDQTGSPTYAGHLAEALFAVAAQLTPENSGLYHYTHTGSTTWYGFARVIFRAYGKKVSLSPVSSGHFSSPQARATRPGYSVLDSQKIQKNFGLEIPTWREGFSACAAQKNTAP